MYYLSKQLGDGTDGDEWRPAIVDEKEMAGVNWAANQEFDDKGAPLPRFMVMVADVDSDGNAVAHDVLAKTYDWWRVGELVDETVEANLPDPSAVPTDSQLTAEEQADADFKSDVQVAMTSLNNDPYGKLPRVKTPKLKSVAEVGP